MRIPSFLVGFLILAGLEVVTSSDAAAGRAALLPGAVASAVRRLLDPTIALIPNWHGTYDGAPALASAKAAAPAKPDPTLTKLLDPNPSAAPKPKQTTPAGSLGVLWTQPTG